MDRSDARYRVSVIKRVEEAERAICRTVECIPGRESDSVVKQRMLLTAENVPTKPGGLRSGRAQQLSAGDNLLRTDTGDGDHRQSAVIELLVLHGQQIRVRLGAHAKRVEAKVAGCVLRAELLCGLIRIHPANARTLNLGEHDAEQQGRHDALTVRALKDGVELTGGGSADVGEDGVEVLLHKEAEGSDHGDTAVSKLSLAEAPDFLGAKIGGETQWVLRETASQSEACTVRWLS